MSIHKYQIEWLGITQKLTANAAVQTGSSKNKSTLPAALQLVSSLQQRVRASTATE
jgi:hypothetical protein